MFIVALFTIVRTWRQPRCPSADEWIRKLWYIYTMENYSAVKKNSFESVLMRWMKLEPIIQSEVIPLFLYAFTLQVSSSFPERPLPFAVLSCVFQASVTTRRARYNR